MKNVNAVNAVRVNANLVAKRIRGRNGFDGAESRGVCVQERYILKSSNIYNCQ